MNRRRNPAPARSAPARKPVLRSFSATTWLAILVGGVLICSLLATGLGTIVLNQPAPTGLANDANNAYEESLQTAIAADPNDAVAAASLANLLSTRGNYDEAVRYYEQALELDPVKAEVRIDFGLNLTAAGHLGDAELQFQQVLESAPDNAEAHYFLGELYARWQPVRRREAVASYERAIAAAPGSVTARQAELALARLRRSASPGAGTAEK